MVKKSRLTSSERALKQSKNKSGIAVKDGLLAEADYLRGDDYRNWTTEVGRDPGLVFVANRPFSADRDVKLVVHSFENPTFANNLTPKRPDALKDNVMRKGNAIALQRCFTIPPPSLA